MIPNILVFANGSIGGDCCLILRRRSFFYPDDGGGKCLRIAANYLRDCTMSYSHIATLLNFSCLFTFYVANLNWVLVDLQAIQQGCKNPGRNKAPLPTEFCTVAPSTCGFSVCNWLRSASWRLEYGSGSCISGKVVHACHTVSNVICLMTLLVA